MPEEMLGIRPSERTDYRRNDAESVHFWEQVRKSVVLRSVFWHSATIKKMPMVANRSANLRYLFSLYLRFLFAPAASTMPSSTNSFS